MLCLIVDAAILGVIIAVMESDEFPDWWRVLICALATAITTNVVTSALLPSIGLIALLAGCAAGALVGSIVISALCGMSVKRAGIAAAIYLGIQLAASFTFYMMFRSPVGT